MKTLKITNIWLVTVMLIIGMFAMTPPASAEDMVLNASIDSITFKADKNGAEYGRAIILEEKSLGGVSYTDGVAVMAFGDMVEPLKAYKQGDTLKAVVGKTEYQGRTSYTLKAFIQ